MTADWEVKLGSMLHTEGWLEVVKPALEASIKYVTMQLVMPPVQRDQEFKSTSDDFMRGQIQALDWVLNNWDQKVSAAAANRDRLAKLDELDNPDPQGSPYAEGADMPDGQPSQA